MRDIRFFPALDDYRKFVDEQIFVEPLIRDHPFYRNLIDFVLCERAPLFYEISQRSEHFGFSGTYHFQTMRDYADGAYQTLFYTHDFTHLLFEYPHDLRGWTAEQFRRMFIYQERLASNESEVLVHYRVPELRAKVLPNLRMWADVLRERGTPQMDALSLFAVRDRLVMDDQYGDEMLPGEGEVLSWLRAWRQLTPKWCDQRFALLRDQPAPTFPWRRLHGGDYEQVIAGYTPQWSQKRYEELTLRNLQLAFALLGWTDAPASFDQAHDAVQRLEGQVFFTRPAALMTA